MRCLMGKVLSYLFQNKVMIRLNINTPFRYVQFWTRDRKDHAVLVDTDKSCFQSSSVRPKTSSVFIELSVNGVTRGFVLCSFPSVNDDDDGLNMNEIVCFYRIWDASWRLVDHTSLTWAMMRDPKICLEWEGVGTICSSQSIVQTHKWLSWKTIDAYQKTLLAPNFLISGEMAFYYAKGDEYASEEWWKECLSAARNILSLKKISTVEDVQQVLSFMLLSDYPAVHDNKLHTIDTILRTPASRADHVCRAYHLTTSLLFSKHRDSELVSFKRKIMTLGGFPYVAWTTKQEFVLLLIPYGKIHSALNVMVNQSIIVEGVELLAFKNAPIIPVQTFCMDSPSLAFLKGRKYLQDFTPFTHMGNVTHVFGNAHSILSPESSDAIAFQTKDSRGDWTDQVFTEHPPGTKDKELDLLLLHRGVINILTTHSKPDEISNEMAYFTPRDNMVVKAVYKIDPSKSEFNDLEEELDKAGFEMDTVYSSSANSWLLRVGCVSKASSFLF